MEKLAGGLWFKLEVGETMYQLSQFAIHTMCLGQFGRITIKIFEVQTVKIQ